MDKQRVEENDVALFHFEVDSLALDILVLLNSEVGLVHLSIPIGVDMVVKPPFVSFREDVQGSILFCRIFKGSPSGNYPVRRPEREVSQVLVERVS